MTSVKDIMQLCRLCLVKEQVNVPIFEEQGDLKRVIQKISACLPVKVSIEDKLPKKICDGCSYKLELLYQFRNATVNAEKQLLAWINQAYDDGDTSVEESKSQVTTQHIVKEEDVEIPDMLDNGETEFLLEQPIAFEGSDIPFTESQDDNDIDDDATNSSDDEPLAKRRRRLLESQGQTNTENSNQEVVHHVGVAKTEDASGTECEENVDDPDPNFISVGTDDIQQPGPSGLNKATADIPYGLLTPIVTIHEQAESKKPNKRKMKKPVKVSKRKKLKRDDVDDEKKEGSEATVKAQSNLDGNDGDLLFKCRICENGQEMTKMDLKLHYKVYHKGRRLPRGARTPSVMQSCEICAKNFKSSKNLNAHMETHNNKLLCNHCHLTFKKDIDYVLHTRTHSLDNTFKCGYCDFQTANVTDVYQHLSCYHEKRHRYTCKICNKGFDVLTWFEEHDNFHTGNKPFECEFCGKTFLYSRYLAAHKSSMHKEEITGVAKIHECAVCNKQYQHKNSLKLHMNSHTGNVAICDICGKQLSSKEKLKFHVRIHTGYKPFKCKYCDKSFTKKPILVEHERIHTGERPYNCEYCHKAFSQRSSLVIHMRTHTGEKPYVCHVCNKGFVARAMLNIHFKSCKGY